MQHIKFPFEARGGKPYLAVFISSLLAFTVSVYWKLWVIDSGYYGLSYVGDLLTHGSYLNKYMPYFGWDLEYPPGIGLTIFLLSLFSSTQEVFFLLNSIIFFLFLFLSSLLLLRFKFNSPHGEEFENNRKLRNLILYFVLAPSTLVYINYNWDIIPVFLLVLSIYFFCLKKKELSAFTLGLGGAIKFFPLIFIPLLLASPNSPGQRRKILISSLLGFLSLNLPIMYANPEGWLFFYKFNIERPPNPDSFWRIVFEALYSSALHIDALVALLFFAPYLILIYLLLKGKFSFLKASFLSCLLFIFVNKVYSPQYNLWLLPFFYFFSPSLALFYGFDISNSLVGLLYWFLVRNQAYLDYLLIFRHFFLFLILLTGLRGKDVVFSVEKNVVAPGKVLGHLKKIIFPLAITLLCSAFVFNGLSSPEELVFDEAHYVPAASQIIESGLDKLQTHPPLAKMFISMGILFAGNNSLGWRLPSAFVGVASSLVFYLIALSLTGSETIAFTTSLFFVLDPLFLVQSRIAMLDVFQLFVLLLAVLCFVSLEEKFFWRNVSFGALIGLSTACKISSAVVLLSFCPYIFLRSRSKVIRKSKALIYGVLNTLACILASLATYVPTFIYHFRIGGLKYFLDIQKFLFEVGTTLKGQHPYSSHAITWLSTWKPVLYYWNTTVYGEGNLKCICACGNPVTWLIGLGVLIYLILTPVEIRKEKFIIPLLWFIPLYTAYGLLQRTTFLFYMVTLTPALYLTISIYFKSCLSSRKNSCKTLLLTFVLLLSSSAPIYLPIALGWKIPETYVHKIKIISEAFFGA